MMLWHSIREWTTGIDAAISMRTPDLFFVDQLGAIKEFLVQSLQCTVPGMELKNFYMRAFGTLTPLSVTRRGRSGASTAHEEMTTLSISSELRDTLLRNGALDVVSWLVGADNRAITASLWRLVISHLRADAVVRDYVCHRAYISALTGAYPDHDASKLGAIEFALSCYARTMPAVPPFMHVLHYWNNSHHPEHRAIRSLHPHLGARLERLSGLSGALPILEEAYADLTALTLDWEEHPDLWMNRDETTEFMYDLLARRWQKDLPQYRGVSSDLLCSIDPKFFVRPWVRMSLFNECIRGFLSEQKTYLRYDAQMTVRTRYPFMYP